MTRQLRRGRHAVAALLLTAGILSFGYVGVSSYVAEQLVYATPIPMDKTRRASVCDSLTSPSPAGRII